ncbi:MAG: hypothetical protein HGA33_04265, partial [Candidatus Moranbacteria bacterium]|nr:hypothetical protein [Candidatus Moranbacteria bacterium]
MGTAFILNPDVVFLPISLVSGLFALISGGLLVSRSFFRFRAQVNQSISMDVELVRVTKKSDRPGEQKQADAWKEEVLVMEKLLEAMATFRRSVNPIRHFFYEAPTIVLEISNPAGSEEILFYVSMPKRFRDGIEKQIHSFFPDAVIEKASDYTIFTPGSSTAVSI